ncbi:hypothetical protein Plhal304r1_c001g0001591 [Plasmopara halstedii]
MICGFLSDICLDKGILLERDIAEADLAVAHARREDFMVAYADFHLLPQHLHDRFDRGSGSVRLFKQSDLYSQSVCWIFSGYQTGPSHSGNIGS